jgi:hypothetical protein
MNILVKGNNWLGDAVMSLPTLRSLKEMEPRSRITVLTKPAFADLYRGAPYVDEVLPHQRGGMATWVRTVRDLKRRKFDAALLLPRSVQRRVPGVVDPGSPPHRLRGRRPDEAAHRRRPRRSTGATASITITICSPRSARRPT